MIPLVYKDKKKGAKMNALIIVDDICTLASTTYLPMQYIIPVDYQWFTT